jgi:hypothetical protein
MFIWLNKQGVRSDTGFEFQRTGRYTAEYSESGRVTEIYVESGNAVVTIYDGSLKPLLDDFQNPFDIKRERERLITNLRDALEFQGLKLDLAEGPEPSY